MIEQESMYVECFLKVQSYISATALLGCCMIVALLYSQHHWHMLHAHNADVFVERLNAGITSARSSWRVFPPRHTRTPRFSCRVTIIWSEDTQTSVESACYKEGRFEQAC